MYNIYQYMYIQPFKNTLKTTAVFLFFLSITPFIFAQEQGQAIYYNRNRGYAAQGDIPEIKKGTVVFGTSKNTATAKVKEEKLTQLQAQARAYREQGLQYQNMGNLGAATALYQKAIELDPRYAVAYNDLGVVYESMGQIDRAEESYFKALYIDSNYLSVYSNLALLYENKRDLTRSAFYWQKRVTLGLPNDPWTEKARQRLNDIQSVNAGLAYGTPEQEVIDLMKDVSNEKATARKDNKELAKIAFRRAKLSYERGDEVIAFQEASDAYLLDPSNKEIIEFIERLQTRVLSR